jgi:hypothetical protein
MDDKVRETVDVLLAIHDLETKVTTDRIWYLVINPIQYKSVWVNEFGWRNKVDLTLRLSKLSFPVWLSIERVFDEDGEYVDDSIMEVYCGNS